MINPITILAHFKTEVVSIGIGGAILTWIGLLASPVTSPKVLAVMVFVTDWNMVWTLEWWLRTIICLAGSALLLAWQRRYFKKQQVAQKALVTALQTELRQADLLIHTLKTRVFDLEGHTK